jgi:ELWxxDGT repeat protein
MRNTFFMIFQLLFFSMAAQTPTLVKDILPGSSSGYLSTEPLVALGEVVFFNANDGVHGNELWRSDGTAAGTYMLLDIRPGATGSDPIRFFPLNGKLFFFANDSIHGDEPWVTDGTVAGTALLKDINPGEVSSNRRSGIGLKNDMEVMNSQLYFVADSGSSYAQLWKTDGTTEGTALVKHTCTFCNQNNGAISDFSVIGNTMYFVSYSTTYKTDGTTNGTVKVELSSNPDESIWPQSMISSGNYLYFFDSGISTFDLNFWKSDGTSIGTQMVYDFPPSGSGNISPIIAYNGKVYFLSGERLWSSDGTAAGTQISSDLYANATQINKNTFFIWKDELYFKAQLANNQRFIHKTAGEINDATIINTGSYQASSFSTKVHFTNDENFIYFDVYPNTLGGIAKANSDLSIVQTIPAGSNTVENLLIAGNNLFFKGRSVDTGRELYKLPLTTSNSTDTPAVPRAALMFPSLSPDGAFTLEVPENPQAKIRLAVFGMDGALMFENNDLNTGKIQLPLRPGMYVAFIQTDEGYTTTQKLIVGR